MRKERRAFFGLARKYGDVARDISVTRDAMISRLLFK